MELNLVNLTRFDSWMLERIIRRAVVQGPHHQSNIAAVYRIVYAASRREFFEDNDPTLHRFLRELFESSLSASVSQEKP